MLYNYDIYNKQFYRVEKVGAYLLSLTTLVC